MLYEQVSKDMVTAMKSQDKATLNCLRMLKSSIDLYLVNNKLDRHEASDEIVIGEVARQIKTHKESIVEFEKGNRQDLVDGLLNEINILSKYLPEQLTDEEIHTEIDKAFDKIKPTSMKDMGIIMKELGPVFKGKADMKLVNEIVKSKLN